ncbi:hypothetical protein X797_012435 [Metarhizium robertsii]|uniref:Uncharacterized protein n=1 Tax=Metarhizium robertsii TaxID=568076 RepID=A0A014MTN5_9HYPO|nr:hypothetical protein X797_012435 [Metarhizium robertsii]
MPTHTVYIYKVSPTFQVNPVSKSSASSAIKTLPQLHISIILTQPILSTNNNNKITKHDKLLNKPNTKKKASKNAEPKRSTKETIRLAIKRANTASKTKAKEAKKAKKAYKAKAAK